MTTSKYLAARQEELIGILKEKKVYIHMSEAELANEQLNLLLNRYSARTVADFILLVQGRRG